MLQIRKLETLHITATEGETPEQIKEELEHHLDYEVVDAVVFAKNIADNNTYTVRVVRRVEP